MNVDATVNSSVDHFGVGVVGRDSAEAIMCVEDKYLTGSFSPLMAELFVIRLGISQAISMGWNNIIFESDALTAVKAINSVHPFSMKDQVGLGIFQNCWHPYDPRHQIHKTHTHRTSPQTTNHSQCSPTVPYSNPMSTVVAAYTPHTSK